MRYTAETIEITRRQAQDYARILDIDENINEEGIEEGNYASFTRSFDNGYVAEISLCVGQNNAYVDSVLFDEDGYEIQVLEPSEFITGDYEFEDDNGNTYYVEIVEK